MVRLYPIGRHGYQLWYRSLGSRHVSGSSKRARHVDVRLRYGEHRLTLRIADDGVGFPSSGVNGAGRGLKNMRERAQLLEGALVVEGSPNEGVTVVLTMPI